MKKIDRNYLLLVISAILFGLIIFGSGVMRQNGYSLLEVLILPSAVITVCLFPFVTGDLVNFYKSPLLVTLLYFIGTFFFYIGQFIPLYFGLSVALTVFLLYTQPIWTIIFSALFLKEKIGKIEIISLCLIFVGLIILVKPWDDLSYSPLGLTFALLGGIGMAGWVIFNAYYAKRGIRPLTLTFFTGFYGLIPSITVGYFILPHYLSDASLFSFDLQAKGIFSLVLVFIYVFVSMILGNHMFFKVAKKICNVHLGLVMLLEPLTATVLDIIFLDTTLTFNVILGGVLIILGNAYLLMRQKEA